MKCIYPGLVCKGLDEAVLFEIGELLSISAKERPSEARRRLYKQSRKLALAKIATVAKPIWFSQYREEG